MYAATVLADSINQDVRLTTLQITFPRFILAEVNTHRTLCLAGDSMLEFDLPGGAKNSEYRRVYRMRLDEFVDKWNHGARRVGANPKLDYDMSWIDDAKLYTPQQAATAFGMATQLNINAACRSGVIPATKVGRTWYILGANLRKWREAKPEHTRFDMKGKLSAMRIRQYNEFTGDIQTSTVTNAVFSGDKAVFEVLASEFRVAGSKDHRVLTRDGWKTIGELTTDDYVITQKFGKRDDDKLNPDRLRRIDGVWRSGWQNQKAEEFRQVDAICRNCKIYEGVDVHHIEPVYLNPSRALDPTNITWLCKNCHDEAHVKQGWQGGTYLYGLPIKVDAITLRGVEPTFDLTIDGEFPNFLANGVVVHNSRSSASSRAIPIKKRIEEVINNPFIPEAFTKNKPGMQADDIIQDQDEARSIWIQSAHNAVESASMLSSIGTHKQHASRVLEPYLWHTAIISATEWTNFFALRISPEAQPEFRRIAEMMKEEMDKSAPLELGVGEWHLPLIRLADWNEACDVEGVVLASNLSAAGLQRLAQISAGRCARVSYLTHEGKRDPEEDIKLANKLMASGHMSPFEHMAQVAAGRRYHRHTFDNNVVQCRACGANHLGEFPPCKPIFHGNFRAPWVQYRKTLPNEAVFIRT